MTRTVDFSNDSLPCELTASRDANKFMAKDAPESHVAFAKLQIGFADSRFPYVNNHFAFTRGPQMLLIAESKLSIKEYCTHLRPVSVSIDSIVGLR